ncbi:MAG: c-type cytochrome [Anaerolineae bacterium]|nr:c-type cytochrome [Anaerolineae bacterium]
MNLFYKIITFKPSFGLRIVSGLVGIVLCLATCGIVGLTDMVAAQLKTNDDAFEGRLIEAGARVYFEQCARCHGLQGKGNDGAAPAISSVAFLGAKTPPTPSQRLKDIGWSGSIESYIEAVTASGIPIKSSQVWEQNHPPFAQRFGGPLRDDQIKNVTKFVANWKQKPYTDGVIEAPKPGAGSGPQPTPIPLGPKENAGLEVFKGAGGCTACHAIRGIATGAVGPTMNKIAATAEKRVTQADYKAAGGKATDVASYLRESIVSPNTYIVPDCPQGACASGVMTQNLQQTLKPEELENLIAYLMTLR